MAERETDGAACKFPGECQTLEGDHCERCQGKRPPSEFAKRVLAHAKAAPAEDWTEGWTR